MLNLKDNSKEKYSNKNEKNDKIDVKRLYGKQCISNIDDFVSEMRVDAENGLTSEQAIDRIQEYGKNELNSSKQKKWYQYFISSLITPFNLILIGIIFVLIYTDIYLTTPPSYANIIVICVLILLSTLLEFTIVFKSNKDAANLKKLIETTAIVVRDGKKVKLPITELTIGDVVLLSAGDLIPGDIRLIESNNLHVSQSSLTGESEAIEKFNQTQLQEIDEIESISDLDDICFMGTNVTSGSGKGIIFKTANQTYFGKISNVVNIRKTKNFFSNWNRESQQIVNKIYACNDSYNIFIKCK